jgi:hypothetical protein
MGELLIGTRKGLFTVRDGKIAGADFLGVPVSAVLPDRRDGSVYAALDHGHFGTKVHRRDPGGDWVEVATPEYPPKPDDLVDLDPMRGEPVPWATKLLWTLEPGAGDTVYAGTIPGGLFQSRDRGASWSMFRSLWDDPRRQQWMGGGYDNPGVHSVSVDPRDPQTVLIGVSSGGVWRSTDGGDTWAPSEGLRNAYMPPEQAYDPVAQDPHRLARCAADPDVVWCQHHNGIFRSTDGGVTFGEITDVAPSTFGFAVAAHPHDGQTAWFVPAVADVQRIPVDGRMVVTRTRDGGATFETLDRGLPAEHAYHLVYRHALDVDDAGERLAMASTTGSLWTSDDAGDQWSLVSSSLPPVACVRWT